MNSGLITKFRPESFIKKYIVINLQIHNTAQFVTVQFLDLSKTNKVLEYCDYLYTVLDRSN